MGVERGADAGVRGGLMCRAVRVQTPGFIGAACGGPREAGGVSAAVRCRPFDATTTILDWVYAARQDDRDCGASPRRRGAPLQLCGTAALTTATIAADSSYLPGFYTN